MVKHGIWKGITTLIQEYIFLAVEAARTTRRCVWGLGQLDLAGIVTQTNGWFVLEISWN